MRDGIYGGMRMSNSTDKFTVAIEYLPEYGKDWVVVRFANGKTRIPSLEDIYRIIVLIYECEDRKYPPPSYGRWDVLNFLADAAKGKSYDELARKYQLPIRQGTTVINSNGANLYP
jgi:hypothetical protein